MKLFSNNIVPYASAEGDKIYPIVVDIKKGIKSGEAISFVTADNQVGVITVDFMDGNSSYSIEGCMVTSTIRRPDGTVLEIPCDIISQSTIEIPLGINGTYQEGVHTFDLKIVRGNGKVIGVPTMSYSVSGSLSSDGVVEGDDRLPVLTMVLDNAQDKLTRLDKAIAGATNDLEVKEARDGEVTLNARLERDLAKGKIHFVDVEGTSISTESEEGYLENVEILGNTYQDINSLSDIRSVGTKVEGQELYEIPVVSCGKNLVNPKNIINGYIDGGTNTLTSNNTTRSVIVKVKPNTTYTISFNKAINRTSVAMFNKMPSFSDVANASITPSGLGYNKYRLVNNTNFTYMVFYYTNVADDDYVIQLEEGTQATPYEPYQEDRLTILSPTPLEKVGDVADRIICKDGVWGVEKNIVTKVLNGNEGTWNTTNNGEYFKFGNRSVCTDAYFTAHNGKPVISDKFITGVTTHGETTQEQIMYYCHGDLQIELRISILASKVDSTDFNGWLKDNNVTIKYRLAEPQFIPLPHDQQIKLRTFANKTNIHFETEIEGTLKAQVPKSLGATVNTHTTQIDNLNKELDRVKKLEESTVTTITTDKAFTTVAETTQGYFEDVKLEGKTLVNLVHKALNYPTNGESTQTNKGFTLVKKSNGIDYFRFSLLKEIEQDKPYTIIYTITKNTLSNTNKVYGMYVDSTIGAFDSQTISGGSVDGKLGTYATKIVDKSGGGIHSKNLSIGVHGGSVGGEINVDDIMLLEGDHTDKDISYFEGLKSVGQDSDEISVSSVNENLFDGELQRGYWYNGEIKASDNAVANVNNVRILQNTQYYISVENYSNIVYIAELDENLNEIKSFTINNGSGFITSTSGTYLRICTSSTVSLPLTTKIQIVRSTTPKSYTPQQSDKKQILYYNPTTQAWEKPVLREWDSIEKHSDGKYYYHKRSGEVVLNGSENWAYTWATSETSSAFYVNVLDLKRKAQNPNLLCDKLVNQSWGDISNGIIDEGIITGISGNIGYLGIRIPNSKTNILGADTNSVRVQKIKTWLQSNPIAVVYELEKEDVYECTNLDLITYNGETNLIVSSGAIQPKLELKVLSNVSNVIKLLQEKVSVLENKFIEGLKQVLAGDMMSLAHLLYPEDFENNHEIQTLEL